MLVATRKNLLLPELGFHGPSESCFGCEPPTEVQWSLLFSRHLPQKMGDFKGCFPRKPPKSHSVDGGNKGALAVTQVCMNFVVTVDEI